MADIVLDNCFYSYSNSLEEKVLSGVSLRVEAGSFISVIGPNGSGKSTLAKLLNGLYIPSSGIVEVDGLSTREKKNIPQIRRKVALLFQNPDNQIVGDTVEEDTAFGHFCLPCNSIFSILLQILFLWKKSYSYGF